ncbi:homeotic protein female sterile [Podospora fimiseda]|uniref:Homeotic protein female sterile n=1 Tax=Podospora fimiseda TaxID=252190 RepID=A0AAN7GY38_9PEZI|nr:homeotic protein female sterile [Podospora fimiseda]
MEVVEPPKQSPKLEAPKDAPEALPFSWLDPHPIFVIVLVGPEQTPYGIQKDFLCSKSSYYRQYFHENANEDSLENIVHLPDTPIEVFAYCQNFMYTGQVFTSVENLPSYDILIVVWKLGYKLGIDGLCDATLDAMIECRRITDHIPATPLLVQVWKDTPEGSSIRKLLLSWAAEYMRSSESRAEFARSLPQEVLSELVVAMSSLESSPVIHVADGGIPPLSPSATAVPVAVAGHRRSAGDEANDGRPVKKRRGSDGAAAAAATVNGGTHPSAGRKSTGGGKASMPTSKSVHKSGQKRRISAVALNAQQYSTDKKMNFCADLLARMLSGPGFWTRVVGPFKDPVDPQRDGVPDYFDIIKKPMDLSTMKSKMDNKEYQSEDEFLTDMNQIFNNCYTYWKETDPMWAACQKLQKSFEDKYSQMNKWISKMDGDEGN